MARPELLRGLLHCHVCGHRLHDRVLRNGRRVYVCLNGRDGGREITNHATTNHETTIGAAEAEREIWRALCQTLADPWCIAEIWQSLHVGQQNELATLGNGGRELEFAQGPRPASVQIPLHEFTQRIGLATDATDFQTRSDLIHFLVARIDVADDALAIEYVASLHGSGWLARAADDFVASAKLKASELSWYVGRLRLSRLVESGVGDVYQLFGQWFALIYLGWLTLGGLMIAAGYVQIGLVLDGGLIVFLLYLVGYMPPSDEARLAWASALPPILRLLSFSVPMANISLVMQFAIVGVPALLATLIMMHALGRPLAVYGIRIRNFPAQVAIAPLGVLVGVIQWLLFEPQLSVLYAGLAGAERAAFVSLFITGLTEELVFRGVLQQGAWAVFGRAGYFGNGLLYANIAFAVMHIGYGPVAVIFAFFVGLLYGALVHSTGSIFGVLWAHGLSCMVLLGLLAF